ncbi:hypothetical protein SHIRM173S_10093 [Streptomyces hirsutus]
MASVAGAPALPATDPADLGASPTRRQLPYATSASVRPRFPRAAPSRSLQVAPQCVGEGVVAEFVEGLGLDLAYALAGDAEDAAYLLQGAGGGRQTRP